MTAPILTYGTGWLPIPLAGVAATTGGAIASVANPEGVDLIVVQGVLYLTAASAGVANVNIGIATDGVTSAADLISALAVNGVTVPAAYNCNVLAAKTALPAIWSPGKFVTVTGTATTVSLAGMLYLRYIRTG